MSLPSQIFSELTTSIQGNFSLTFEYPTYCTKRNLRNAAHKRLCFTILTIFLEKNQGYCYLLQVSQWPAGTYQKRTSCWCGRKTSNMFTLQNDGWPQPLGPCAPQHIFLTGNKVLNCSIVGNTPRKPWTRMYPLTPSACWRKCGQTGSQPHLVDIPNCPTVQEVGFPIHN